MNEPPAVHLEGGIILGSNAAEATAAVAAQSAAEQEGRSQTWADVPWRTIFASVGVVLCTVILLETIKNTLQVISWIALAGFFAIVLAPLVARVQPRVGGRRGVAVSIVVFSTLIVVVGLVALFIMPVRTQLIAIITDLPGTVKQAADGRGPVGRLVGQLNLDGYVQDNESELQAAANRLSGSGLTIAREVLNGLLAFVTITLITFFFLSQSAAVGNTLLSLVPFRRREPAKRIATDAAAAISGYMIGNLLVSAIAGAATFVFLFVLGVPNAIVIALWVAFADLLPFVGATLGAIVGVLAAFLHDPTAGYVSIVFFIVYQQVENGVIYPNIMSRKVKINPLAVLLGVLIGVQLFGILGAVLAVPFSGAAQVVVKAIGQEHRRDVLHVSDAAREPAAPTPETDGSSG